MEDVVIKDLNRFLSDIDNYQAKEDHVDKVVEDAMESYSKAAPDFFDKLSPTTIKAIEEDLKAEEWQRLSDKRKI